MPCRQASTFNGATGSGQTGGGGYATEADCLQACKEGACCDGTTCSVKPQCQCQGAGKTFKGVGTTCAPNPCDPCFQKCASGVTTPSALAITISNWQSTFSYRDYEVNGTYVVPRLTNECFLYFLGSRPTNGLCVNWLGVEFLTPFDLVITIGPNGGAISMKGCLAGKPSCECFTFTAPLGGVQSSRYCSRPIAESGTAQALFFGNPLGTFSWSIAEHENTLP